MFFMIAVSLAVAATRFAEPQLMQHGLWPVVTVANTAATVSAAIVALAVAVFVGIPVALMILLSAILASGWLLLPLLLVLSLPLIGIVMIVRKVWPR